MSEFFMDPIQIEVRCEKHPTIEMMVKQGPSGTLHLWCPACKLRKEPSAPVGRDPKLDRERWRSGELALTRQGFVPWP